MVITLTGQKGGSGKTTTAISIADELHRRGRNVLLVDTDPQATARTWGDVAAELEHDGPTVIGMGPGFHERLEAVASSFDDVVIDCPPGESDVQRAALMVADVAVVPCGPGATDVWSMAETVDLLRKATAIRPSLEVAILRTRVDARTLLADQTADALEQLDIPVLSTALGFRVAYQEAPHAGLGPTRYATGTAADREVRALVDELAQLAAPALREVV